MRQYEYGGLVLGAILQYMDSASLAVSYGW